ncbi:MAG: site-2 protease family protein [Anaerolineae bacterium]|nr:site-2 protease family protein [Anaerolineae bacterium]
MEQPQPALPRENYEHVDALRQAITDLFLVYDTTLDYPDKGYLRFRGRFLQDPADCFPEMRRRFERHGFTPTVNEEGDRTTLIALPIVFEHSKSNRVINLVLFIATIFSTLFVGASYAAETPDQIWQLWRGWPFSASILLILGAHELGHYFAARHHNVPVTLPYFLPMPLSLFGTLGAFIRLQGPVTNRRALFDVGAAGPLAGLVFALPVLFIGLATSAVGPVMPGGIFEGNSILYSLAKLAVFGRLLPGNGVDVHLNQVAWAGWVGLFVTGLNLIPVGQLDGGHVAYALFGKRARLFFWPAIVALGLIVLYSWLAGFFTPTWLLWIFLLLAFGRVHARPLEDITELDPRRRVLAVFTLALFFLAFVPFPLAG